MRSVQGGSEGKRRLTIREAATLLGVHYNTVSNRIKRGEIEAEKVVTERGPTWLIDPDSLITNTSPSDSQQLVGRVPEEALTILAREIVREAGLGQAPEEQRRLEVKKMDFERAKSQMFVLSGVLVASVAVGSILPPQGIEHLWLLLVALSAAVGSYSASYSEMFLTRGRVAAPGAAYEWARTIEWMSFSCFVLAVPLLMLWVVIQAG
jgi:excisionase family DNA binding protein